MDSGIPILYPWVDISCFKFNMSHQISLKSFLYASLQMAQSQRKIVEHHRMEGSSEHLRGVPSHRPSSPQKIQENSDPGHGCQDMKNQKLAFSPLQLPESSVNFHLSSGVDMKDSAEEPLMSVDEFLKQRGQRSHVKSTPNAKDTASECSEILFDGTELSPPHPSPLPRELRFTQVAEAKRDTAKKTSKARGVTRRRITEGVEKV